MAKGKRSGKSGYTSAGIHSNVSSSTKRAVRRAYIESGERVINQLAAFRAGKRVMVTIENPNKNETNKRFIRVEASTVWKRPAKPGSGAMANV
jgi:hypothetical protein